MVRIRRSLLAISAAGLLCLAAPLSGAAHAATAGGVKGDPQPELKPFTISAADNDGTAAMESNGDIVVAYVVDHNAKVLVCVLARGKHTCTHSVEITPPNGLTGGDVSEVFAPSPNKIVLLQSTCCDNNPNGDDLIYTSTNGGRSFGAPVRVGGTIGVATAALIDGNIVFGAGNGVESVPLHASGPPGSTADPLPEESFAVGLGSYQRGVLFASEDTNDNTRVAYAKRGSDFNATSSYHLVGRFSHEDLLGISGDALLTVQTTGKSDVVLRFFNGTGFGSGHVVPSFPSPGPAAFGIDQDPARTVHVFADRAAAYDLIEYSSSSGSHWTKPVNLGNAIADTFFSAALDSHGSGLVLGTGGPGRGYPVLASQRVTFSLASSTIARGRSTTGSGKVSPAASGREVALQVERGGLWYTVATTPEKASGSFRFTIKGTRAGTFSYRAVASDLAGYVLYGYSSGRSLHVKS